MSRQQDRSDLTPEVRIRMAEDDLDRVDRRFEDVTGQIIHKATNLDTAIRGLAAQFEIAKQEHKAEMKELREDTEAETSGNRKLMTGMLVSMLFAAVSFISVLLTIRGGG